MCIILTVLALLTSASSFFPRFLIRNVLKVTGASVHVLLAGLLQRSTGIADTEIEQLQLA